MKEQQLLQLAMENLKILTGLTPVWIYCVDNKYDGTLEVIVNQQRVELFAIVRQEIRNHQLPKLMELTLPHKPVIIIANNIFPKIKEELRQHNIAYLEANGNIFIKENGVFLWIDTQRKYQPENEKVNRAFTKTGLKVVFQCLLDEQFVNRTYREIAELAKVGLGNVNYIMNGLKEMNYLIKLNQYEYKLLNRKELLDKWLVAYQEKLRPTLKIGTFRFANIDDFSNWKRVKLNTAKTCWGAEPAGDILTGYLRPEKMVIYTNESRNEMIRNYKLIPDINGNVDVYTKFWDWPEVTVQTAPPLLVYTDLMNEDDKRCRETALKIYEQYLQ
jgi:hypothetical protein